MIRFNLIWFGLTRFDSIRFNSIRFDSILINFILLYLIWSDYICIVLIHPNTPPWPNVTVAKDTVCEVGLELESCKPGEICAPLHSKSRYCTREQNFFVLNMFKMRLVGRYNTCSITICSIAIWSFAFWSVVAIWSIAIWSLEH